MGITWPDNTGLHDPDLDPAEWENPLAEACRQLNFEHSLVYDAHQLRASMVDALLEVATALEWIAATWERCAEGRRDTTAIRYRGIAAKFRDDLADVRDRATRATALPIGTPRGS